MVGPQWDVPLRDYFEKLLAVQNEDRERQRAILEKVAQKVDDELRELRDWKANVEGRMATLILIPIVISMGAGIAAVFAVIQTR